MVSEKMEDIFNRKEQICNDMPHIRYTVTTRPQNSKQAFLSFNVSKCNKTLFQFILDHYYWSIGLDILTAGSFFNYVKA